MFTAVDAYDRFVGRYSAELARRLIATSGLAAGDRALDVGCGPGGLTTELVALVGSDHVAAVDPSPAFVEACRTQE
jgi:ubiquinone/menaquinone biosynthesis C-methylase UbiE